MIEAILREALEGATALNGLADYGAGRAIFYADAAREGDGDWAGGQYPLAVFGVDWSYDAERNRAGGAFVDIYCAKDGAVTPEDIAQALADEISGLFLTDVGEVYALLWNRLEPTREDEKGRVRGVTAVFDVMAFPTAGLSDASRAAMAYVKALWPEAVVIGLDQTPRMFMPGDATPACYVRTMGVASPGRQTFDAAWLQCQLAIHVFCPGFAARAGRLKALSEALALEAELTMADDSPMLLKRISVDARLNPLTRGQVQLTGEYGVLRSRPASPAAPALPPEGDVIRVAMVNGRRVRATPHT